MNIKWNWGTKLTLFIILFMGFIFVLVYFTTQNRIILVEKDYYPKGMKFQNRIDERKHALHLKDSFQIEQNKDFVVVSFPEINPDTGTIVFFRHNDNLLDQTIKIRLNKESKMFFPVKDFKKGRYLVKFHWFEKEKGFYVEKSYYFN